MCIYCNIEVFQWLPINKCVGKNNKMGEKAWTSLVYTPCARLLRHVLEKKMTFCYILNHVITVCFWCEHTPVALHRENGQNDARLYLPPVSCPSPAVRCHRCSARNSGPSRTRLNLGLSSTALSVIKKYEGSSIDSAEALKCVWGWHCSCFYQSLGT